MADLAYTVRTMKNAIVRTARRAAFTWRTMPTWAKVADVVIWGAVVAMVLYFSL